ncbi:hypothetical protein [Nonomuraea sp. NPDC049480]|uniref:hypothetical protein n=1 Tax=Nonomuraea sp. NPDC049480 TaxID=3364353 RepID=UPI0037B416D8
MSQPLTDQRPRAQLIAELYDRYAAGLFAYCADQLGDLGSASDVLASVLSGVPDTEPPRAALYAYARREIHRRDIVYSPPAVDPLIDPATALVERTLRELRPHQREVLVLCAVCGLSKSELAWVLDVAPDTAEELAVGAGHRFRHALGAALASTGVRVPKPIADVYGALGVAPLRDVLGRLPWPQPPGALRIHFAGSRAAAPAPLFVKPRWPSPPVWPQPLADADPASSTMIFPKELLTPPSPSRVSQYEATTAPLPQLSDSLGMSSDLARPLREPLSTPANVARPLRDPLSALDAARPFVGDSPRERGPRPLDQRDGKPRGSDSREWPPRGRDPRERNPRERNPGETDPHGWDPREKDPGERDPRGWDPYGGDPQSPTPLAERSFFMAPEEEGGAQPFATGDVFLPKDSPEPFATGDVLLPSDGSPPPLSLAGDVLSAEAPDRPSRGGLRRPRPRRPQPSPADDVLVHKGPARPLHLVPQQEEADPVRDTAPQQRVNPIRDTAPQQRVNPIRDTAPQQQADPIRDRAPLFKPRPKQPEPVYRLPWEDEPEEKEQEPLAPKESLLAPRAVRARPVPKRRPEPESFGMEQSHRRKDRHYDWAWEVIGFLICVAIAMIVFFSVPMFVG